MPIPQSSQADSSYELAAFSLSLSWVDLLPLSSVLSSLLSSLVLPEATMSLLGTSSGVLGCYLLLCVEWCAICWHWLLQYQHGPSCQVVHWVYCWGCNPTFSAKNWWWIQQMSAQHRSADKGNVWHGKNARGGVPVSNAGLLVEAGACEPLESGVVVPAGESTLHCTVVTISSFM